MIDKPNGARVRRLRTSAGLSQVDLAEMVSIPATSMSKIENDRHPFDDALVASLSTQLGCSPQLLSRPNPEMLYTKPWLRAYADASKKLVDQYIEDTLLAAEAVTAAQLRAMPDVLPTFDGDPEDESAIEQFAEDVRGAAGLADGAVVANATRAAERLGCVVLPMQDELGRHWGLSMRVDDTPYLRVARPRAAVGTSVAGDRQRFTTAHELGHVAMHASVAPPESSAEAKRIETQAHRFAAAFLVPAEALLGDLDELGGAVTLNTLAHLKQRWGVAIKMLVVRFRHLGVINEDQARSLYKQISARGWNKSEPISVGSERAVWLEKAIFKRFDGDGARAFADTLGIPLHRVQEWLDWDPIVEQAQGAEIVQLQQPSVTPVAAFGDDATVTHLPIRPRR